MSSVNNKLKHKSAQEGRLKRFSSGVFGTIQQPRNNLVHGFYYHPPEYNDNKNYGTIIRLSKLLNKKDIRCFYSGILLDHSNGENISPQKDPCVLTKDHLVPLRRDVPDVPHEDTQRVSCCWVPSAYIVNNTLGLSPLMVRLTIRRWLSTVYFDRDNPSPDDIFNVRWTIISMFDHFRHKGRFFWSRNEHGKFWYPESKEFMERMWKMEKEFLMLDTEGRKKFCSSFVWNF